MDDTVIKRWRWLARAIAAIVIVLVVVHTYRTDGLHGITQLAIILIALGITQYAQRREWIPKGAVYAIVTMILVAIVLGAVLGFTYYMYMGGH